MKFIQTLLCVAVLAITGCQSVPLREINYRGELPTAINDSYPLAMQFANDYAATTGLQVTFIQHPTGNSFLDKSTLISLGGPGKITVSILVDKTDNHLFVIVQGDIDSPLAKTFADQGVKLFQKKYPDGKIAPYTRYQTFIGP